MPRIDRQAIYERDGGLCGFCGKPVPPDRFHIDHITPRAIGGTNELANLRVAHQMCNISAGRHARTGAYTKWNEPMAVLTISGLRPSDIARMHQMAIDQNRSLNYIVSQLLERGLDEDDKDERKAKR